MKKIATLLTLLVCGTAVFAQTATTTTSSSKQSLVRGCEMDKMTPQQRQEAIKRWQNMTPADKQAMQTKMEQRWQNMSPEMKQMAMERMMMKWNSMSADEQQKLLSMLQGSMKPMTGVMTPPPAGAPGMNNGPMPPAPGMNNGSMPPAPGMSGAPMAAPSNMSSGSAQ
ncbi:MAG: DUF3106 domain-containing protein [Gammaproteobacteria bacterium]|nr:DUF3106 domain-containing protein [Gammaproteobacteria bacterium]